MKRLWTIILAVSLAITGGCAAGGAPKPGRSSDATNPRAPSAHVVQVRVELRQDEFDREVAYAESSIDPNSSGAPDADMDATPETAGEGHQHDADGAIKEIPAKKAPSKKTPIAKKVPATERTPAAPKSSAPSQALYVCPMHPEVTDDKPSKCPKCGMALILKKEKS